MKKRIVCSWFLLKLVMQKYLLMARPWNLICTSEEIIPKHNHEVGRNFVTAIVENQTWIDYHVDQF